MYLPIGPSVFNKRVMEDYVNKSLINKFALASALALSLSACERGHMKISRNRLPSQPISPQQKEPVGPTQDNCPQADGKWVLDGGITLEFARKDGVLNLIHGDLGSPVVLDGKSKKIEQTSTKNPWEITGKCEGGSALVTWKSGEQLFSQVIKHDKPNDQISVVDTEGDNEKITMGVRAQDPQGSYPPGGY